MKRLLNIVFATVLTLVMVLSAGTGVWAVPAPPPPQVPLNAKSIPQFVDLLPLLSVAGGTMETAPMLTGGQLPLYMIPLQAKVLPTTVPFVLPNGATYASTKVFGYRTSNTPGSTVDTYIGPVILAKRGQPLQVQYKNNLGTTTSLNTPPFWSNAMDVTLHWANPNYQNMVMPNPGPPPPAFVGNTAHYTGAIPAVAHLHGGEVPARIDGGPDAWFLSDGSNQGHAYYSDAGALANEAWYTYPNTQEAAPIWFHDHVLGATRINVYAGLAGGYLLSDDALTLPAGLGQYGLARTGGIAAEDTMIPLVIQDRMFDTNGELFFPSVGINPDHPYWVPEFLGDVICVNGKSWPFLRVKAQRYRFLFLNGSNARTYEMSFQISGQGKSPTFWQIATDGGYLNTPAPVPKLVLMPGERADVIVDFAGLAPGTNLILENTAKSPYPAGAPPSGSTTGRIMQFRVIAGAPATDSSYNPNPATGGGQALRPTAITPLIAATVNRQLTLNEVIAPRSKLNGVQWPGGPVEILVNNTKWAGVQPDGTIRIDFTKKTQGDTFQISGGPGTGTITINPINAGSVLATPSGGATVAGGSSAVVITSNSGAVTWTTTASGNISVEATATLTSGTFTITTGTATTAITNNESGVATPPPAGGGAFSLPEGASYYSELPKEGTTELWEIINLTADAHPIHLHLVQFQLKDRQALDVKAYTAAYNGAFPGGGIDPMTGLPFPAGVYMPAYGPPLNYTTGHPFGSALPPTGILGGNPALTPVMLPGVALPPAPNEAGWKDTVMVPPGMVTRFLVRWAPTDSTAANLWFPFNPDGAHGYVWHCHIIDHEDNEMMRPTSVEPNPVAPSGRP